MQQHLGSHEAQQSHEDLTEQQLCKAAGAAQHEDAEEQSQPQTAAQTHGPADEDPQPREGDGVACRLTGALAVQQPAQRQQHQSHRRVDRRCGQRLRRQAAPVDLDAVAGDILSIQEAYVLRQLYDGRQPLHEGGIGGVLKAEVEPALQELHHAAQKQSGEVHRHIQHRDGQQPAGGHGAQSTQRQEKQLQQLCQQQPLAQRRPVHHAEGQLRQHRQQEDQQIPGGQQAKARQKVGEVLGGALDRQGVHHAHGAGRHQVGVHRHGDHHAAHHRQHQRADGRADDHIVQQRLQIFSQRTVATRGVVAGAQQLDGQDHQPYQHIDEAGGPEVAQVAAQQRSVTEGCLLRHSPHLPTHR